MPIGVVLAGRQIRRWRRPGGRDWGDATLWLFTQRSRPLGCFLEILTGKRKRRAGHERAIKRMEEKWYTAELGAARMKRSIKLTGVTRGMESWLREEWLLVR